MGVLQDLRKSALANALREEIHGKGGWDGLCLKWVRTQYGTKPDGKPVVPARDPSAIVAWQRTAPEDRHGGTNPPPGVPVFWKVGKYGHVALSTGDGKVRSTDILRHGKVDQVAISTITKRWNAKYLGWTETLNGKRVISNREAGSE